MIFAFMLAPGKLAKNVSWKRVKNGFAKAFPQQKTLEMLIGFALIFLLVLILEFRTTPGTILRARWSSSFSLSSKTGSSRTMQ
jgi:hypothetical protein